MPFTRAAIGSIGVGDGGIAVGGTEVGVTSDCSNVLTAGGWSGAATVPGVSAVGMSVGVASSLQAASNANINISNQTTHDSLTCLPLVTLLDLIGFNRDLTGA